MKNLVERSIPALITQAGDVAYGAGLHGAAIPLVLNTEAGVRAKITSLSAKILAYAQAREELSNRRAASALKAKAVRAFLAVARDMLKPNLGTTHNQAWAITGFATSLKIERTEGLLLTQFGLFTDFLTAHPEHELPTKNITAALAETLHGEFTATRGALLAQEAVVKDRLAERNVQAEAVRQCVKEVIGELGLKVSPLDNRWLAFGLNRPGQKVRPDVPANVTVVLFGTNAASVKWSLAARADHYRVWIKVDGVDTELRDVGSPADLDFLIENLPSNTLVEVAVSAVNNGGESAKSQSATIRTL